MNKLKTFRVQTAGNMNYKDIESLYVDCAIGAAYPGALGMSLTKVSEARNSFGETVQGFSDGYVVYIATDVTKRAAEEKLRREQEEIKQAELEEIKKTAPYFQHFNTDDLKYECMTPDKIKKFYSFWESLSKEQQDLFYYPFEAAYEAGKNSVRNNGSYY